MNASLPSSATNWISWFASRSCEKDNMFAGESTWWCAEHKSRRLPFFAVSSDPARLPKVSGGELLM